MFKENKTRSILKTVSWRIWATVTTFALVFLFIGEVEVALTIGVIEVFIKMLIYFLHERVWDKIKFGRKEIKPAVFWFTGLSGSGKSTLSKAFYEKLVDRGLKVEYLDGDSIRNIFPKTGYSKEERNTHIKRVGYLASKLEKNGVIVIASFISPYKESRYFIRNLCDNFIEVYISTPLEECERRDVKGLYAKARRGEIKQFTGIDDPYEKPENPEVEINTIEFDIEKSSFILSHQFEKIQK
jgi:adenylylsulfate kinase